MTSIEYQNLARFPVLPCVHAGGNPNMAQVSAGHTQSYSTFNAGDIFKALTIYNSITYVKVVASWENMFFDLEECKHDGTHVPGATKCNMIAYKEIKRMITERYWQLHSSPRSSKAKLPSPAPDQRPRCQDYCD